MSAKSEEQHKKPKSDIEISQAAKMRPVIEIAKERLGIPQEYVLPYGHYKAKISLDYIDTLKKKPDGKLILVTAITPTPAGEGKTTTTVGLGDALNAIGKKALICIREPSLGPCFGVKGGAAGGGYAQVVPMEDINLHFTGDFHAIGAANNLLAALIDNHVYWGNALDIDTRRITWRRAVDMNDRALREIVTSLGGAANGYPREAGFDITVASEVMAIFCLASDLADLQRRLGQIQIGQTRGKKAVTAKDLSAAGSMAALLKDALAPNLVQTLENNPGVHSWRSVRQYRAWLQFGDRHQGRAETCRLCGDRGRVRRRSRRGEILRHQMPQSRTHARLRGAGRDHPRAEDAWRRRQGRAEGGECRGAGEGLRQSQEACRESEALWRAGDRLDQSLQHRYAKPRSSCSTSFARGSA